MPNLARYVLSLVLGLALVLPASAWAQGRGNARGHEKDAKQTPVIGQDDDRDEQWDDRNDRGDDRDDRPTVVIRDTRGSIVLRRDGGRTIVLHDEDFRRYPVGSNRGPSFCRSGAGHPVFGVQWCLNKGYGIGQPGSWFLRGDDLFLRGRANVFVLRDRGRDADRAFWGSVVGQLLALVD